MKGKVYELIKIVVFILIFLFLISGNRSAEDIRFDIPKETSVNFSTVGKYIIYHEYTSQFNDTYRVDNQNIDLKKLKFKIVDSNNNDIKVKLHEGNTSYKKANEYGNAILEFNIENPGEYKIIANYDSNIVILISYEPSFFKKLREAFLLFIVVIIVIVYNVKNRKYIN